MKYFPNNQSWSEITREERYFCAELFFALRNDPDPFLGFIDKNKNKTYEIAFEACFYRDVLKSHKFNIRKTNLPYKRTFDLMLLADDELIIIEAKANQGFHSKQLGYFENDKIYLASLFQLLGHPLPAVSFVAIHSSKYPMPEATKNFFNLHITWHQLAEKYLNFEATFTRADAVYGK